MVTRTTLGLLASHPDVAAGLAVIAVELAIALVWFALWGAP